MVITAKFGSTCPRCGRSIAPGTKVEWQKGSKATHVDCHTTEGAAPAAAPRAPKSRRTPREGEQTISRISSGRGDGYAIGATFYLPRVGGGSGDGHWHTVVSAWVDAPNEDFGSPDWTCRAIVRPATDAERAEAAANRRETQRRAALAALPGWIAGQVRHVSHHTEERAPRGAWQFAIGSRMAGSETLYLTDDAVWYVTSSYDEGPTVWRMPITSEMVAGVAAMVEALS